MNIYEKIKDLGGWLTPNEADLLYNLAKNTKNKGEIVEIGSWKGRSTICLALGSKEAFGRKVYAIDPHTGSPEHKERNPGVDTFDDFKKNIKEAGVSDLVEPIRAYSFEASKIFDKSIEFLFIDGAHEYEAVLKDFEDWFPKVAPGGIIAFHDSTGGAWDGPTKVVNEKVFTGNNFKDVGFVDSISFGTKVLENTEKDRRRSARILKVKKRFEYLRKFRKVKFLKPFKKIFKIVFRILQGK
ncbi:class I SAM-dependent methyltransferase [Candidatus Falkowbacteria bacterium]|nr:class I SAM-dependent methyltransferase [Candidatus Falkowbacteria bacterium]